MVSSARDQRKDSGADASIFNNPAELVARGPEGVVQEEHKAFLKLVGLALALAGGQAALTATPVLAQAADVAALPFGLADSSIRETFVSAFLLIFFSEIGDKTFFIAVLLAIRQSRTAVFAGTFGALAVMTFITVFLGRALHELDALLPKSLSTFPLDDVAAIVLLVVFGVQTIIAAKDAEETVAEEKDEAKKAVDALGVEGTLALIASTFSLVLAAEWGDKSFISTIALAAAKPPLGVVGGAIAGHGIATALAVLGGSLVGKYVPEKAVGYAGGTLFLVFAAATFMDLLQQM